MGSDITKPVKRLVRSIEKRGISVGIGTNQPLYVASGAVPVNVDVSGAVNVNARQAVGQLRAAAHRPRSAKAPAVVMPSLFPIYRWSLDATHHLLSFDNINPPAANWRLNPTTPLGQVYKEAAHGKMIAFDRYASSSDLNLYYYTSPAGARINAKRRAQLGLIVHHASNVFFAARGGRRVHVDPSGPRLGTIYVA